LQYTNFELNSRTNSNVRTKITPYNVESSPTVSSINQTLNDDQDMDLMSVDDTKTKRVSVSEPAEAPAGRKTVASTMEIGFIRDLVFNVAVFHEHLSRVSVVFNNLR